MLKNLLKECKKYALDQALTGKTVAIGNMCARPQVRETESELAQVVEKFKGDVKEAQEEIEEYRLFVGIYGVMPLLKNRAPAEAGYRIMLHICEKYKDSEMELMLEDIKKKYPYLRKVK